MWKVGLLPFLVLGVAACSSGQSAADLSAADYFLRTAPRCGDDAQECPDGQVCEMVLERRQKTDAGMVFGVSFSEREVKVLSD